MFAQGPEISLGGPASSLEYFKEKIKNVCEKLRGKLLKYKRMKSFNRIDKEVSSKDIGK